MKMETIMKTRIVGQKEAIKAITHAIRRSRAGLNNPERPISTFIFAGPPGVGKSELAKTLAKCYFGTESSLIRIDMSEYMERHTLSKLIGSPPGYVGYQEEGKLTQALKN